MERSCFNWPHRVTPAAQSRYTCPLCGTGHGHLRKYFFEALAFILVTGSLLFFYQCVRFLARRDYVSAILLMFIGFAVIRVGAEFARLALLDRT